MGLIDYLKRKLRVFPAYSDSLHESESQQNRMRYADSPFIYVAECVGEKAIVRGNNGDIYETTLYGCSCKDFAETNLPCKHMYKLAFYLGKMEPEEWYAKNNYKFKNMNINPNCTVARSDGIDANGMSMECYKIVAVYLKTKRQRTSKIYAASESEAVDKLGSDFQRPVISIEKMRYTPATDRQIQYAEYNGIKIPSGACKEDASAILDHGLKYQDAPNASEMLIKFAKSNDVLFSKYCDEPLLIKEIYCQIKSEPCKQFAFMVACLYKSICGQWGFSRFDKWLESAEKELAVSSKFVNSLNQRSDCFMGFEKYENYNPPSKNSYIYKTLMNYVEL